MITKNNLEDQIELEKEIRKYAEAMDRGENPYPEGPCRKCGKKPAKFKIHDYKTRIFLVIVNALVKTINTWLARWKCPLCNRTFVRYPDFAFPYKNYVKNQVMALSEVNH